MIHGRIGIGKRLKVCDVFCDVERSAERSRRIFHLREDFVGIKGGRRGRAFFRTEYTSFCSKGSIPVRAAEICIDGKFHHAAAIRACQVIPEKIIGLAAVWQMAKALFLLIFQQGTNS